MQHTSPAPAVAEIQGLYGPFTFPEKLLQKIWSRRDFDTHRATTADGCPLRISHTGKWNHLGGPDFTDARLGIGGAQVAGDVELHLRESDWHAHRHAADPAYSNVVLHVVLFPPRNNTTPGAGGRAIPILTLLPLLRHDLEEYVADDAIERFAGHPPSRAAEALSSIPCDELPAVLARHAEKRWRQKIHYARLRIDRLGWDEACHHAALEILGYSRNRPAMLAIATLHPLENWRQPRPSTGDRPGSFADDVFSEQTAVGAWAAQASRPANNPLTRLRQYAAWTAARPDWPRSLLHATALFGPGGTTSQSGGARLPPVSPAAWRRANNAPALRRRIRSEICGDALGGTRLNTFVCDGLLPLLAAQNPAGEPSLREAWHNWFAGDMPAQFARQLRAFGVTGARAAPARNGATQGLLGFLLEAEAAGAANDIFRDEKDEKPTTPSP